MEINRYKNDIKLNLLALKTKIAECEKKYGRPNGSVKLLAVSKSQSIEKIKIAYAAGQRLFGENYLQEALAKIKTLADTSIEWHFIGSIQRNKTRKIAENFAWVETVESEIIAKRLSEQRPENLPALNICLQVNISNEASKAGVNRDQVLSLADYCSKLPRIKLRGLMSIPARESDFKRIQEAHQHLFLLWKDLHKQYETVDTLSMGMSSDFETAIAEGSTLIRIGTAIFSHRLY